MNNTSPYDRDLDNAPSNNNNLVVIDQAAGAVSRIETRDGIITAQRVAVPRDEAKILAKIKVLAAAAGDDWYYRWSVKDKSGKTSWIEGISIKGAQSVARLYGNCQVDCRAVDSATHTEFLARFVDYETGYSLTRPFRQRKSQSISGKMDADRQADLVFQIGASKATRNVISHALETFTDFAFDQARESIVEKIGKQLEPSRKKLLDKLNDLKIYLPRVENIHGKKSAEWLAPDIAKIVAEVKSIEDGMSSKDECYPPTQDEINKHLADEAAKNAKPSDKHDPQTGEIPNDYNIILEDELLPGLNKVKSSAELQAFVKENEFIIADFDKNAPEAMKQKYMAVFAEKLTLK